MLSLFIRIASDQEMLQTEHFYFRSNYCYYYQKLSDNVFLAQTHLSFMVVLQDLKRYVIEDNATMSAGICMRCPGHTQDCPP